MYRLKLKPIVTLKQLGALVALLLLMLMSRSYPLIAQSLTQGYLADVPLQRGMMVRLTEEGGKKVEQLTSDTIEDMFGVVTVANDAAFTVSGENEQVFVATSGDFPVLVSNQNGEIKEGDLITISAIKGVGMKTGTSQVLVLGKALEAFDGTNNTLAKEKIKNASGEEQTIGIGLIQVAVDITRNPFLRVEANVPSFLKKAAEAVVQKDVGANRIYLGVVMLILSSIVSGIVLYAGIRSSIIALGRNPLSKKTIIRSMIQVIITSVIIFLCGVFGVYLLLRL